MGEKEKIKVSLTTVILLFLVFFLIVAMAGMYLYYNYVKNAKDQTNTTVESIEDETVNTQEKTTEISLSDSEKIDINKKLGEYITLPLRQITDITRSKDFIYNKNFLNEEKNKYYIVLNIMQKEILNEFNQFNNNGEIETSISVNKVNEYYNKIFGINLNEEKLLNANTSYNLRIKDGMLYGSYDTGWGINPFELKAKKLVKNNETDIYTLTADVLMKIKEYHADFTEFDDDVTIKYGNPEVLTWPEEYEYAELEIQYKKDSEGKNQLISMSFVKNTNE